LSNFLVSFFLFVLFALLLFFRVGFWLAKAHGFASDDREHVDVDCRVDQNQGQHSHAESNLALALSVLLQELVAVLSIDHYQLHTDADDWQQQESDQA
jgi:hypothetical protein